MLFLISVDMPSIATGNRVAFLDPHEKYFNRGEPGQQFSTAEPLLAENFDQFEPFYQIFDCNINQGSHYSGTLFRFPLRTQPSQLSTKIYTREMVHNLFDSFKNEAGVILLFLKNVDSISLYEREDRGEIFHLYTAEVSQKSRDEVRKKRQDLIRNITADWDFTVNTTFYHLEIEKKCPGKPSEKNEWFVANQVGTGEKKLIELAQSLMLLPWIGIAFPVESNDTYSLGRIFCFLPLPPDGDCRTGLPVQVNGYFGLTDNRRALKWPGPDCQNDETAQWNKLLLQTVGSQVYANLIVNMVRDCSANLPPDLCAKIVYSALPDFRRVRQDWACILQPLFQIVLARKIFLTTCGGNSRWINLGEAIVDRLDETKGIGQEIKEVVLRTLLSAGQPVVSLPEHVIQIIDQYQWISGWATVKKITPGLFCNVLRSQFDFHQLDMTFEERLLVLEYALQNAPDLHGVPLLPLENHQFVKFSHPSVERIFIPSQKHSADLLPNMKHRLLYRNLSIQVQQKFHELGCSKVTQLHHPTAKDIKQLLWQNLPDDWSASQSETVTWNPVTNGHPSLAWLQLVWHWINENYSRNLDEFEGMPIIPVSINPPTSMARLRLNSTVITREHPLCNERLSDVVRDLLLQSGCVVVEKLPSFIKHDQLLHYISLPNPPGILSVLTVAKGKVIKRLSVAPDNVRHQLCSILSRLDNISSDQASFIRSLPIFEAVHESHFVSCETVPGRQRLVAPRNFSLPKKIRIVDRMSILACTKEQNYQLLEKLGMRIESTASLIAIHLNTFLNSGIRDIEKDNLMIWILQRMDAFNEEMPGFIQLIREMSCIPTSSGKRIAPNRLFDNSDGLLTRLLEGNNEAFPKDQFSEPIRRRKDALQIRRKENLTAQDVFDILSQTPKMTLNRGKALAELVNQRPQLLRERLLSSILREFPWVPRVQNRPGNYPDFVQWYDGMSLCKPNIMVSCSMSVLVGATVPVFDDRLISSEVQSMYETLTLLKRGNCSIVHAHKTISHNEISVNPKNICYVYFCLTLITVSESQVVFKKSKSWRIFSLFDWGIYSSALYVMKHVSSNRQFSDVLTDKF